MIETIHFVTHFVCVISSVLDDSSVSVSCALGAHLSVLNLKSLDTS